MSSFYMYQYDALPSTPPTELWYASWSTTDPCVHFSQAKPTLVPDGESSWVVGVIDQEYCPSGAEPLSSGGGKSLPPRLSLRADSVSAFKTQFGQWVVSLKGGADFSE